MNGAFRVVRETDEQPKRASGNATPKRGPAKGRRALYRIYQKKEVFF
jgi:hypothetical protein